ncbi:hypothetical protein [Halovivax gelatinilyticus]|uniref:hypothetical protein n=1 Tax=Halovivax gelatinilyticus TaxID=2961597 RepID=UPI0020CA5996|nr:hypothetical protein [Halovivax gelatinilyticus]
MSSAAPELLVELLTIAVYAVLALAFTVIGLLAETTAFDHYASGELVLAGWFVALGAVLLYAGVVAIGYQKLFVRVQEQFI